VVSGTISLKGHSHCAPYGAQAGRTAPRSAASNSEIETGAITAAKSAPHCAVQRRTAPCGADGAQTGAALLRRTARSVNATLCRYWSGFAGEKKTVFTAQCTLVQSAVLGSHVVRLSVRL